MDSLEDEYPKFSQDGVIFPLNRVLWHAIRCIFAHLPQLEVCESERLN